MEHQFTSVHLTNSFVNYDIDLLLLQLQSGDGAVRHHAREALCKIGKHVVPLLLRHLSHRNEHVRWETCKILGRISDPNTGYALAETLLDDNMDVRWVAAEALITLGPRAIEPLLQVIEVHSDSSFLRESSHHVLSTLKRDKKLDEKVEEVFNAIKDITPPTRLGFIASEALDHIRRKKESYSFA